MCVHMVISNVSVLTCVGLVASPGYTTPFIHLLLKIVNSIVLPHKDKTALKMDRYLCLEVH